MFLDSAEKLWGSAEGDGIEVREGAIDEREGQEERYGAGWGGEWIDMMFLVFVWGSLSCRSFCRDELVVALRRRTRQGAVL